jgi:hypothetical protein
MSLTYKFDPDAISISARFYAGEYFSLFNFNMIRTPLFLANIFFMVLY